MLLKGPMPFKNTLSWIKTDNHQTLGTEISAYVRELDIKTKIAECMFLTRFLKSRINPTDKYQGSS